MNSGTKVILKNAAISCILFLVLPMIIGIFLSFVEKTLSYKEMIKNFYGNFHPTRNDIIFFAIQIIVIVFVAVLVGNKYERQIKRRNLIATNIVTIFSIWAILFITCIVSDGLLNRFEFHIDSWIAYGFGTFLLFAFLNFLLIGFFMGKSLK